MHKPDLRLAQLRAWLDTQLSDYTLTVASADASFRRYFRISAAGRSFIAMDAPPERESCQTFLQLATLLRQHDIPVPAVIQQNTAEGFLLLSDFGNTHYLQVLNSATVDDLYSVAMQQIWQLQQVPTDNLSLYDKNLLQREMQLFLDWFLQQHLQITLDDTAKNLFADVFDLLLRNALAQPQVFVHRDYHSRNLMHLTAEPNIGILDFQDAVKGPITYDLVSLLRDCYIRWPKEQVNVWVKQYYQRLQAAEKITVEFKQFQHWFDWMGVQRHLKAVGIFARLQHRDQKPGYLADIPRTLGYIIEVSKNYTELKPLADWLQQQPKIQVLPA